MVGKKRKRTDSFRDEEFYVSHTQKNVDSTDQAYSVHGEEFMRQANAVQLDMHGEDATTLRKQTNALKWDSKKKRFIRQTVGADNKKMIRTESGTLLPATYRTNAYVLPSVEVPCSYRHAHSYLGFHNGRSVRAWSYPVSVIKNQSRSRRRPGTCWVVLDVLIATPKSPRPRNWIRCR